MGCAKKVSLACRDAAKAMTPLTRPPDGLLIQTDGDRPNKEELAMELNWIDRLILWCLDTLYGTPGDEPPDECETGPP